MFEEHRCLSVNQEPMCIYWKPKLPWCVTTFKTRSPCAVTARGPYCLTAGQHSAQRYHRNIIILRKKNRIKSAFVSTMLWVGSSYSPNSRSLDLVVSLKRTIKYDQTKRYLSRKNVSIGTFGYCNKGLLT